MTTFQNLGDVRREIDRQVERHGVSTSRAFEIVDVIFPKVMGTDLEQDTLLLLSLEFSCLADDPDGWEIYKYLVSRSTDRSASAYIIAESALVKCSEVSSLRMFNATKAIYFSLFEMIGDYGERAVNRRIGCAMILHRLGYSRGVLWILREISDALESETIRRDELNAIANNEVALGALAAQGDNAVRTAADRIIASLRK